MSAKTYTLFVEGQDAVNYGSKKTAVKYGDESGKSYQVHSPSGAVVKAVEVPVITAEEPVQEPETAEETEQAESTTQSAPEPVEECIDAPVDVRDLGAMKTKIAKLLSLAERTDNDAERDAFNDKAEHLMLRLGIARAELESVGKVKPEEIIERCKNWHGNYSIVMVPFVFDVAQGFGNLTILQSTSGPMLRRTYIVGHVSDVDAFQTLIDSLALQVLSALRRWQRENASERRDLTDMQKYVQNRSFITGFGKTVRARLEQTRTVEEKTASSGAAIVLASKADRVNAFLTSTYGEMKTARGGAQYHSSVGMMAGRRAGESADLGNKSVKGKGALSSKES